MGQLKIDNLDDEPISFDLTDEDFESIKGGVAAIDNISIDTKSRFPIKISPSPIDPIPACPIRYPIRRICIIVIKAPPPIDPVFPEF